MLKATRVRLELEIALYKEDAMNYLHTVRAYIERKCHRMCYASCRIKFVNFRFGCSSSETRSTKLEARAEADCVTQLFAKCALLIIIW